MPYDFEVALTSLSLNLNYLIIRLHFKYQT